MLLIRTGMRRHASVMFSVQIPGAFVLGTSSRYTVFRLRDQWIVLGTIAFRFVIGTIRGLRSLTSIHYTGQPETLVRMIDRLTLGHDARSPQLCAKPLPVEHVLSIIAFRLRFGGILRGRFVPRTWFDRVPAGTVLAGTRLFRTRSDYKKWCVLRTCSENMFPLELYREQVWTPGKLPNSCSGKHVYTWVVCAEPLINVWKVCIKNSKRYYETRFTNAITNETFLASETLNVKDLK